MRQPEPALAFYLRHAADIEALRELRKPPNGITGEDWQKFREVVKSANQQAASLIREARDAGFSMLKDTVIPDGFGSREKTIEEELDGSMGFKLRGKGNRRRVAYAGILLEAAGSGARLVAYVTPVDSACIPRLSQSLKKAGLEPKAGVTAQLEDGWVPIAHIPLTPTADLDTAITACRTAFAKAKKCLVLLDE